MEKLFIKATRKKLRFESTKGNLSIEQLWDLPLTSKDKFSLDAIAVKTYKELEELNQGSFVTPVSSNPAKTELSMKLEILKTIIEIKLDDRRRAEDTASRSSERSKLLDAMAEAEKRDLASLSKEEILKRLANV